MKYRAGDRVIFNGTGTLDKISKRQFTINYKYYISNVDGDTIYINTDNRTVWGIGEEEADESFDVIGRFSPLVVYRGSNSLNSVRFTSGQEYFVMKLNMDKKLVYVTNDDDDEYGIHLDYYYTYFVRIYTIQKY